MYRIENDKKFSELYNQFSINEKKFTEVEDQLKTRSNKLAEELEKNKMSNIILIAEQKKE